MRQRRKSRLRNSDATVLTLSYSTWLFLFRRRQMHCQCLFANDFQSAFQLHGQRQQGVVEVPNDSPDPFLFGGRERVFRNPSQPGRLVVIRANCISWQHNFPPTDVGPGRDLASAAAQRPVSLRTIRLSVRPTTHANRDSSLLLSRTSPEGRPRRTRRRPHQS